MFSQLVNAACIHNSFIPGRIGAMARAPSKTPPHESMQRLLAFARETTRSDVAPITDFSALGQRLQKSAAVITNWKARGISKDGAMQAEMEFGCSARWLMTGEGLAHAALSDEAIQRASVWERLDVRGREFFDRALDMARLTDRLTANEPPPAPYATLDTPQAEEPPEPDPPEPGATIPADLRDGAQVFRDGAQPGAARKTTTHRKRRSTR
jgi:hypothetical protein